MIMGEHSELNCGVPTSEAPREAVASQTPEADLRLFFAAKGGSPAQYVKRAREGVRRILSEGELAELARSVIAARNGLGRLLGLLQALDGDQQDTVVKQITRLAEYVLWQEGVLQQPSEDQLADYAQAAQQWLKSLGKRTLSGRRKITYLVLVILGSRNRALDEVGAIRLLETGFAPKRSRPRLGSSDTRSPNEAFHKAISPRADILALLNVVLAWRENVTRVMRERDLLEETRSRTQTEKEGALEEAARFKRDVERLRGVQTALEQRVERAEALNADIQIDFRHRVDQLRSRVRGVLAGELSRWLETAYDASVAEPPRSQVIQERLEQAIALIRREIEWLGTSA
jgi:hypothetical protein